MAIGVIKPRIFDLQESPAIITVTTGFRYLGKRNLLSTWPGVNRDLLSEPDLLTPPQIVGMFSFVGGFGKLGGYVLSAAREKRMVEVIVTYC